MNPQLRRLISDFDIWVPVAFAGFVTYKLFPYTYGASTLSMNSNFMNFLIFCIPGLFFMLAENNVVSRRRIRELEARATSLENQIRAANQP